ncbi:hypothetical protein BJ165DRAFT_1377558, partial [Panaeolus papilionaceus]
MPARGARSAPIFNSSKPSELKRYFIDLEYLFKEAKVTNHEEKIGLALRYVDIDVADLWATLPESSASPANYDAFKRAVQELYPDADENERYSLKDLELCTAQAKKDGMYTLKDAAEYHRKFTVITHFLIEKGRLSNMEANRLYIRGFQERFWVLVSNRLQLKDTDHHPADPWDIKDVYSAVKFMLRGTSSVSRRNEPAPIAMPSVTTERAPISPAPIAMPFETEDFTQLIAQITKNIVESLQFTNQHEDQKRSKPINCHFCGKGHFIRDCPLVSEYIEMGKCQRNEEGKIILPSGAEIPRGIAGTLIKDRLDEYHRQHPDQLAA